MKRSIFAASLVLALAGCATVPLGPPSSIGEQNSGANYIALDPLPVHVGSLAYCRPRGNHTSADALDALPDNAVRIAVQDVSGNAQASFGPVVVGAAGSRYRVVLDYITADTANIRFRMTTTNGRSATQALHNASETGLVQFTRLDQNSPPGPGEEVVIPVYVGTGLRLTALVDVRSGHVNLASLGALSAAVEARRAVGTLVV